MALLPKLKIYVQLLNPGCHIFENAKGDMFDLRAAENVTLHCPQVSERYKKNGEYYRDTAFENHLTGLGVRILLPKGMRANLQPRSGTWKNFHTIQPNSPGCVDWEYNGPHDEWKVNLIALGDCEVHGPRPATEADYCNSKLTIIDGVVQGDRIAQFEVVLSHRATFWQKVKWLFHSGIEIVYVDNIDTAVSRDGFNSSGVQ